MFDKITAKQFYELEESLPYPHRFVDLMKEYTGLEARPCLAYQFFDAGGCFVGDNWDDGLADILITAEIEVVDDGKE